MYVPSNMFSRICHQHHFPIVLPKGNNNVAKIREACSAKQVKI